MNCVFENIPFCIRTEKQLQPVLDLSFDSRSRSNNCSRPTTCSRPSLSRCLIVQSDGVAFFPADGVELDMLYEKNDFFVNTVKKYQIYVQKCPISPKNPIAVVKNSLNQVLLCVIFANFCESFWEKANGWLWPPPHLNSLS